ncbi:zinc finger HIT domain-containing protein 1 [Folsomia candida]|uniref:Zinc finger HIT domain-containing protein 1 n=1 Tax=Folsomia candida TaxID=158441 RepID=A0A226EX77_FOLCA|nr:zinc finger HIT domain-containing protein 1 [Folsomia candida]OXA62213.1 Zinc finger HIT domain-containing protein 1 [Folsomia candida]
MTSRERESRSTASGRVLDAAARYRRQKKALEALEQDNFHDEPHADLVMSKRAPKFQETLESKAGTGLKKKKKRDSEYYKIKYRKPLNLLVEEEQLANPEGPNYSSCAAPPSKFPSRSFCNVCGFEASYNCVSCGSKFCSIKCSQTHQETRCLKWTA